MKRYGMVIGLKPGRVDEYTRLHAAVWPGVLAMIESCHVRNYSIYLHREAPDRVLLFSYFEYTGDDFAADMARMAADPTTQEWWRLCEPCQEPVEGRAEGEWWANLAEVFHTD